MTGHGHELPLHGVDVLFLLQGLFQRRRLGRNLRRTLTHRLFQLVAIADQVLLRPLAHGNVGVAQHVAAVRQGLRAHGQHLAARSLPLEAVGQPEFGLLDALAHHRLVVAIAPFAPAGIVAQDILEGGPRRKEFRWDVHQVVEPAVGHQQPRPVVEHADAAWDRIEYLLQQAEGLALVGRGNRHFGEDIVFLALDPPDMNLDGIDGAVSPPLDGVEGDLLCPSQHQRHHVRSVVGLGKSGLQFCRCHGRQCLRGITRPHAGRRIGPGNLQALWIEDIDLVGGKLHHVEQGAGTTISLGDDRADFFRQQTKDRELFLAHSLGGSAKEDHRSHFLACGMMDRQAIDRSFRAAGDRRQDSVFWADVERQRQFGSAILVEQAMPVQLAVCKVDGRGRCQVEGGNPGDDGADVCQHIRQSTFGCCGAQDIAIGQQGPDRQIVPRHRLHAQAPVENCSRTYIRLSELSDVEKLRCNLSHPGGLRG